MYCCPVYQLSYLSASAVKQAAVVRVNVQAGAERLPVLEMRLPGCATLGELRSEVARRFRIPAHWLELFREVLFVPLEKVERAIASHSYPCCHSATFLVGGRGGGAGGGLRGSCRKSGVVGFIVDVREQGLFCPDLRGVSYANRTVR